MKPSRLFALICLLLAFALGTAHGQSLASGSREICVIDSSVLHSRLIWVLPEAKLQDTCFWDTIKEPPLSPPQAIAAARAFLNSRGEPDGLQLSSVQLRQPSKTAASESLYFYLVTFGDPGAMEFEKKGWHVVVLLDGSAVAPITIKLSPNH